MKSLTQFIQEACKNNNCNKIKKTLQDIIKNKKDILDDTKRLKKIDDILKESLDDKINESNDYSDPRCKSSIKKFKILVDETYLSWKNDDPNIEVGLPKDSLIEFINQFNSLPAVSYKLEYDEHLQKIADRLAYAYNDNEF